MKKCNYYSKKNLKDGFQINYHFALIRMRKKDLVRAVHNKREAQRHLLEKNGT